MNRNLAIVAGLGAFGLVVVALLLKKGPTSFTFGDIGSKLSLPSLGGGMSEAETKQAIASVLDPMPQVGDFVKSTNFARANEYQRFNAALASWQSRNP